MSTTPPDPGLLPASGFAVRRHDGDTLALGRIVGATGGRMTNGSDESLGLRMEARGLAAAMPTVRAVALPALRP